MKAIAAICGLLLLEAMARYRALWDSRASCDWNRQSYKRARGTAPASSMG